MSCLKGHLLIATPQLKAPVFSRSVILMLEQNEEGALGVILNQRISATMSDLAGKVFVEGFDWDKPISLGGPVPSSLIVLHAIESLADQEVISGVYMTADSSKVQELIVQRPEPSLVLANYSGWGPGQLDGEISAGFWLVFPATIDHVFGTEETELWKAVVTEVGRKDLADVAGVRAMPADPSLN
jgi:putative transcriptional regulator